MTLPKPRERRLRRQLATIQRNAVPGARNKRKARRIALRLTGGLR